MIAPKDTEVLVEQAVQAALDAGVAENGKHGVAAARVAARHVLSALRQQPSDELVRLLGEARSVFSEMMSRGQAHMDDTLYETVNSYYLGNLPSRIDAALAGNPAATPEQSK